MLSVTVSPACGVTPNDGGHRVGHRGRVADGGQLDQPDPVGELRHQLGRDLHREAGLAHAAHAGERHQPVGPHQLGQLLHLDVAAHEARRLHRAGSPAPRPPSATARTPTPDPRRAPGTGARRPTGPAAGARPDRRRSTPGDHPRGRAARPGSGRRARPPSPGPPGSTAARSSRRRAPGPRPCACPSAPGARQIPARARRPSVAAPRPPRSPRRRREGTPPHTPSPPVCLNNQPAMGLDRCAQDLVVTGQRHPHRLGIGHPTDAVEPSTSVNRNVTVPDGRVTEPTLRPVYGPSPRYGLVGRRSSRPTLRDANDLLPRSQPRPRHRPQRVRHRGGGHQDVQDWVHQHRTEIERWPDVNAELAADLAARAVAGAGAHQTGASRPSAPAPLTSERATAGTGPSPPRGFGSSHSRTSPSANAAAREPWAVLIDPLPARSTSGGKARSDGIPSGRPSGSPSVRREPSGSRQRSRSPSQFVPAALTRHRSRSGSTDDECWFGCSRSNRNETGTMPRYSPFVSLSSRWYSLVSGSPM